MMAGVGTAIFAYVKFSRVLEPHGALRRGASKLVELMPARYVVMGHTHRPVMEALSATATYVNLGNWTADLLDDHAPPAPCTHLVIRHGEGGVPSAALCRWEDGHAARVLHSDEQISTPQIAHETAALRGGAVTAQPAAPRSLS
jgi:hypothetical protein